MFGDICNTCSSPVTTCTCPDTEAQPCLPSDTGYCKDWLPMDCVFWMGDDIAGTPIKKGTPLTAVVTYLLQRIKNIETSLV